jgi:prolyl oligopeptidase
MPENGERGETPGAGSWLEDGNSPTVRAWERAQSRRSKSALERLPVASVAARLAVLRQEAATAANPGIAPGATPDRAAATTTVLGRRIEIFRVKDEGDAVVACNVRPDGRAAAVWVSHGGAEATTLHLVNLSRKPLREPIPNTRPGALVWYGQLGAVFETSMADHRLRALRFASLRQPGLADYEVFGERATDPQLLGDRWLVAHGAGAKTNRPLLIADTTDARSTFAEVHGATGESTITLRGERLYLVTTVGAPRGRVVTVDIANPQESNWVELVAESDAVLAGMCHLDGGRIAVHSIYEGVSRITVHDGTSGALLAQVPLPGLGVVQLLSQAGELRFAYADTTHPWRRYAFDMGTQEIRPTETGRPAHQRVTTTQQVFIPSSDGVSTIPVFITRAAGAAGAPAPTILDVYGGFNDLRQPGFNPRASTWTEAGGVWVHALLPGDGHRGRDWHKRAAPDRRLTLQACEDVVRWLHQEGITTPSGLGITGASNGGLTAAGMLTRVPELLSAAVIENGLTDMVRHKELGWLDWTHEYGSAEVAEERAILESYSPLQMVRPGVNYPPTLVVGSRGDTRVNPAHGRMFAAALQQASPRTRTFFASTDGGHLGKMLPVSTQVLAEAEQLTFMADALGLDLASPAMDSRAEPRELAG